jgi:poly-gamma-glutamate synthesis protein (capsule biosynthesis protein)
MPRNWTLYLAAVQRSWLTALLICSGTVFHVLPCNAQVTAIAPTTIAAESHTQKKEKRELTVAAVGDIIAFAPFVPLEDPGISAVMDIITKSDVGFGNLEGTLFDPQKFKGYAEAENGGMWLIGEPQVAADLRAVGFRLLARANNHSTEWGRDGMRATDRELDKAGIVHAGTGDNRAKARAASFLKMPEGTVGLVSMASSFTASSVASPTQANLKARPGMNALRTEEFHIVSPEMMDALVKIRDSQAENASQHGAKAPSERPTELHLFDVAYRIGSDVGGSAYQLDAVDLSENVASMREAKKHCDLLIATIHSHEPGNWSQQPPDFLIELAHHSIDAGADEFVGHGPHQLRGIEIYKGRPIFYSLGNFIFEVEKQTPVPVEMYEALKLDPLKTSDAELDGIFVKRFLDSPIWYQSVVAVTRFEHGRATEVHLYPIELGFDTQGSRRGLPRTPSAAVSEEILKRLQKISEPFHTEIMIQNQRGIIRLPGE